MPEKWMKKITGYIHLCGDGEIQEGQIWEAAMFAGYRKAGQPCCDRRLTTVYRSMEQFPKYVISHIRLDKKFEAFNFHTITIDGNDFDADCKGI